LTQATTWSSTPTESLNLQPRSWTSPSSAPASATLVPKLPLPMPPSPPPVVAVDATQPSLALSRHSAIEAQVPRTTDPSLPMTVSARIVTPETLVKVVTEAVVLVVAVVVLEAPPVVTDTTALATPVATTTPSRLVPPGVTRPVTPS